MKNRRLEILLPADMPARDYTALTHAIWAVLDAAGVDDGCSLRPDEEFCDAKPDDNRSTAPDGSA
ncbi:hypothetical protein [Saccharothrix sp. HUAS TT1]|uniref:hypothetical protein n=1 Tax=unclassified Saccharothrix TaxID=2593673 RepID=UPI00345B5641